MKNKEFGSDFHYMFDPGEDARSIFPANTEFFFSGRVALYNLLEFGIDNYGWRKVAFPSYYCHDVVTFCRELPIKVEYYSFNPVFEGIGIDWEDKKGNVLINVDLFGMKKTDSCIFNNTVVIDDLTHNLLDLKSSRADYCIASVRKQLPLAVGGLCYAPKGDFVSTLPENRFANNVALEKLSAMHFKSQYLVGRSLDKSVYRSLFLHSEEEFSSLETNARLPSIIGAQLNGIDPLALIKKTRKNIYSAKNHLKLSANVKLLDSGSQTDMGLVFVCPNNNIRDKLKLYLIENSIFPAILWPNQKDERGIDLETRILFVHVDFRYTPEDVLFITTTINSFFDNV